MIYRSSFTLFPTTALNGFSAPLHQFRFFPLFSSIVQISRAAPPHYSSALSNWSLVLLLLIAPTLLYLSIWLALHLNYIESHRFVMDSSNTRGLLSDSVVYTLHCLLSLVPGVTHSLHRRRWAFDYIVLPLPISTRLS